MKKGHIVEEKKHQLSKGKTVEGIVSYGENFRMKKEDEWVKLEIFDLYPKILNSEFEILSDSFISIKLKKDVFEMDSIPRFKFFENGINYNIFYFPNCKNFSLYIKIIDYTETDQFDDNGNCYINIKIKPEIQKEINVCNLI